MLAPGLVNHAEKKVEPVSKREDIRFPGFNDCKDPLICMAFRRELENIVDYVAVTPFTQLKDYAGTENGKRLMREQLKRKYARDLKQILTEHPKWASEMGMTDKQVRDFKSEEVTPSEVVDVPGDYRAR